MSVHGMPQINGSLNVLRGRNPWVWTTRGRGRPPEVGPDPPRTTKWPIPVRWRRGDGRRDLFASIGFDIPVLTLSLGVTTVGGDCTRDLIFIWSPSFNGYELLLARCGPAPVSWWWWIWMRADVFNTLFLICVYKYRHIIRFKIESNVFHRH